MDFEKKLAKAKAYISLFQDPVHDAVNDAANIWAKDYEEYMALYTALMNWLGYEVFYAQPIPE